MENKSIKGMCHFENNKILAERIEILIAEWSIAYPHVKIVEQMRWAHAWLVTHPDRPKKLLARFLNNWMQANERRALERGYGERRAIPRYVEEVPEAGEVMTGEDWRKIREGLPR